jgi:ribosomal protein S18 acetylase RimI-like enzyme
MPHVAATFEDFASAGRLLHDFNTEFDDPTPGPEALAVRIAGLLVSGTADVLLDGADDGEPSALCVLRYRPSLWSEADECYLAELYVAPAARGTGIGRRLLRASIERAREQGCDFIDLSTSEDDVAARHLYEAEGFRRTEGAGGPLTFHYEMDL